MILLGANHIQDSLKEKNMSVTFTVVDFDDPAFPQVLSILVSDGEEMYGSINLVHKMYHVICTDGQIICDTLTEAILYIHCMFENTGE